MGQETINRIKKNGKAIISDLAMYLGGSVSTMSLKELSDLFIALDHLQDQVEHFKDLSTDRMEDVIKRDREAKKYE